MRRLLRSLTANALVATLVASSCAIAPALAKSDIKDDEEVLLFTTLGRCNATICELPVHGWIFEPEEDSIWRSAIVSSVRDMVDVAPENEKRFKQRMAWFLVDNERGKDIVIRSGKVTQQMGESGSDGHFGGRMVVPRPKGKSSVTIEAIARKHDPRRFTGKVLLLEEEGLSVISDIDDTIKVTEATDKRRTLENTFLHDFKEIPGQAARYRAWQKRGAAFHYLSASPWHLYVPLRSFLYNKKFPEGSMHLQKFRVKELSAFNLLKSPADFKKHEIQKILQQFPKRRFILVGDSGQADPEVYMHFAKTYPKQIEGIYIREIRKGHMSKERLAALHQDAPVKIQLIR